MVVGVMDLATEAGIPCRVARFFGVDPVRVIFAFGDEWSEWQPFFPLEMRLKFFVIFEAGKVIIEIMIWLIAILLLAIFAGMGFLRGAVQMGISLVGLFLALALAVWLAPPLLIDSNVGEFHGNAIGRLIFDTFFDFLHRVGVFLLVSLVFLVVGIVVHFRVRKHFRFKTDEATQLMFRRLNKRIGAAFGLLIGTVYTILVGVFLYGPGYLTYQVATSGDPGWLKFINYTRKSMEGSGLEKMAASLDPMPSKFYEVSDIIGLFHKNPLLESRFRNYPPFLKALTEAEVHEDTVVESESSEFRNMLAEQSSIVHLAAAVIVLSITDLGEALLQADLKDLRTFLEKGESPIYSDEKILGRWQLDGNATINHMKRTKIGIDVAASYVDGSGAMRETSVKMKSREFRQFKEGVIDVLLNEAKLFVFPDEELVFVPPRPPEPTAPREPEEDEYGNPYAEYSAPGSYGAGQFQRRPQPVAPPPQKREEPKHGSWKRQTTGRYKIQFENAAVENRATFKSSRLIIKDMFLYPVQRSGLPAGSRGNWAIIKVDLIFSRVY